MHINDTAIPGTSKKTVATATQFSTQTIILSDEKQSRERKGKI